MISKPAFPPRWPMIAAAVLFLVTTGLYGVRFAHEGFSSAQEQWGQFGDFVGGLVNPLLGILTIWLLLRTLGEQQRAVNAAQESLRVQHEALEVQRSELELTRLELKDSAQALAEQVKQFDRKSVKDDLFGRADTVFREFEESMKKSGHYETLIRRETDDGVASEKPVAGSAGSFVRVLGQRPGSISFVDPTSHVVRELEGIAAQLIELRTYLVVIDQYSGGNRLATNFFRRRVRNAAGCLARCSLLPESVEIHFRLSVDVSEEQAERILQSQSRARESQRPLPP